MRPGLRARSPAFSVSFTSKTTAGGKIKPGRTQAVLKGPTTFSFSEPVSHPADSPLLLARSLALPPARRHTRRASKRFPGRTRRWVVLSALLSGAPSVRDGENRRLELSRRMTRRIVVSRARLVALRARARFLPRN